MIRTAVVRSLRLGCPHKSYIVRSRRARLGAQPQSIAPHLFISRSYVTKTTADEKIEELQELYATAKDEFELASEETEKKTIYAADDRVAAHEELETFKAAFEDAVKDEGGEEIKNRIGQRVRELENAVQNMDEMAKED